jgi:hypothetical protein
MNLKELNEEYDEYILSEEYLIEGLKIFKESKKLYNFAEKINKKAEKGTDPEAVKTAKKLADDIVKLADQYKVVEDAFANKELDRATATNKLKELKTKNESLSNYIKDARTKSLLTKLGLGVVVGGLGVLLGSILVPSGLFSAVGAAISSGVGTIAKALGSLGAKFGIGGAASTAATTGAAEVVATAAPEVVPTAMQRGALATGMAGSSRAGSKLGRGSTRGRRR